MCILEHNHAWCVLYTKCMTIYTYMLLLPHIWWPLMAQGMCRPYLLARPPFLNMTVREVTTVSSQSG